MQNACSKAERVRALENGKGIQHLLQAAYEILGNPILLHDMEYKAIDYNKNIVTDDPIWNEYVTTGTVGYQWLDFFKNECFLEAAANTSRITFLLSDKLQYDRIYGKLFNRDNMQIGCAVMTACNRPFACDDPVLFDEFCTILSAQIGKDDFYNEYGQAYFEKLLGELIAGISDKALYAAHVESIYMHLKSKLYFAIVDIGKCDAAPGLLAYYRDLLKRTQPAYTYALYANHIVMIIDTDEGALSAEKDLAQLNRLFRERNMHAGISSPFENLFDLHTHYEEALVALNKGLATADQRISFYE